MNNLDTPLSERFAAFVSTLPKPVQDNIEASYKRGESFTAQAFEAGWMAAQDDVEAIAEQMLQIADAERKRIAEEYGQRLTENTCEVGGHVNRQWAHLEGAVKVVSVLRKACISALGDAK